MIKMTPRNDLLAAYSYVVVMLALKYVDNVDKDGRFKDFSIRQKLAEFNQQNDFGIEKINLFPFLITIANGTKQTLLEFFNKKFDPVNYGIIQTEILDFVETIDPSHAGGNLFSISSSKMSIQEEKFENAINQAGIDKVILDWINEFGPASGSEPYFTGYVNLLTPSGLQQFDFRNVFRLIDHSIKCLDAHMMPEFSNRHITVLTAWVMSTKAHSNYYKYKDPHSDLKEKQMFNERFNKAIEIEQYEFI